MFSRDLEVHALAIETTRLMVQAEGVLRTLTMHQKLLVGFLDDAEAALKDVDAGDVGQSGAA